jgi:hypothetical protein
VGPTNQRSHTESDAEATSRGTRTDRPRCHQHARERVVQREGASPHSNRLPEGLTVAIQPRLGHPANEYFAYVNGTPPLGRSVYVSSDLGLPALRADGAATDPPSPNEYASTIHRNQVGGAKTVDGGTYEFTAGETAYNGVRIRFGPETHINRATWLSFLTWTSFIGGTGSGPFQIGQVGYVCGQPTLRLANSFGLANPLYHTRGYHDSISLPFPYKWMDVIVGVRYSTSWTGGWIEVSWKWATEPVSAFRAMRFPVAGHPVRYITRTIGDTPGDNRFGPYSGAAVDVQEALADFFVAPRQQTVLDAFGAISADDSSSRRQRSIAWAARRSAAQARFARSPPGSASTGSR